MSEDPSEVDDALMFFPFASATGDATSDVTGGRTGRCGAGPG